MLNVEFVFLRANIAAGVAQRELVAYDGRGEHLLLWGGWGWGKERRAARQ